jgi:hypothetical protein
MPPRKRRVLVDSAKANGSFCVLMRSAIDTNVYCIAIRTFTLARFNMTIERAKVFFLFAFVTFLTQEHAVIIP